MKRIGIGILLLSSVVMLAAAPSGWKVVTDKKKTCQYAVPADWTQDALITSSSTSGDKKSSAVIHGSPSSLAETKSLIQQMIPVDKIIEDSGKRYWYSYKHLANAGDLPGTNWYVAVPSPGGVCAAQISFKDPGGEAVAKQIVDTIGPIK